MRMANETIRSAAKKNGVFLWEIADVLGVSEPTITRMLRRELAEPERARFLEAIHSAAQTKRAGA